MKESKRRRREAGSGEEVRDCATERLIIGKLGTKGLKGALQIARTRRNHWPEICQPIKMKRDWVHKLPGNADFGASTKLKGTVQNSCD